MVGEDRPLALLELHRLVELKSSGMTRAQGAAFAEAAAYCLEERGHMQGVELSVDGDVRATFELTWKRLPSNADAAYGDESEATEQGAVALAILLARIHLSYEVIARSWKDTGYDYLMKKVEPEPTGTIARLEVSGIRQGTAGEINQRIRRKARQVRSGKSRFGENLAIVIVIEFNTPVARIREL